MSKSIITEETVCGLFAEGKLTPQEFGLAVVEVRRFGACHPTQTQPCEHVEGETCDMVHDVFRADGTSQLGEPHCANTCPNLWDVGGITEGIGGEYPDGATFSYIGDDDDMSNRVWRRASEVND